MNESRSYLYQQIAESIRRQIAMGEFKPEENLPSVRDMARRWSCTTGTVGRAYQLLVEEGLVIAHTGRGTTVASNVLQPQNPPWQWASLVNRAEQLLLDGIRSGFSPAQIQSALTVATTRLEALQAAHVPTGNEHVRVLDGELHFVGSHDLIVELIARMLAQEEPPLQVDTSYKGSLGGLIALARHEADVAGVHLWDQETQQYNEPFVRRLLPGQRVALLTLAHRAQGIITRSRNPLELRSLQDLAKRHVRFVNRQAGSGTRVWLDAQLDNFGIEREQLFGYDREVTTHMDVARAVAEGQADAGLGIHAAAAAFDLAFVPLAQERYDLIFTEASWQTAAATSLRGLIVRESFRDVVVALGGYDTAETGRTVWI